MAAKLAFLMALIVLSNPWAASADDLFDDIDNLVRLTSLNKKPINSRHRSNYPSQGTEEIIMRASRRFGIDPVMVHAIIKNESNYNPHAVSRKGAVGLMQLMPETAREIGVNRPFDPRQNILGGTYYYRRQLDRFGSHRKALWAYNCGPRCVERGAIPRESRRYANNVIRTYKAMKRREKGHVR